MFDNKFQGKILCCDPDPDSRQSLAEKLKVMGYEVLATGNPQIASGLFQEQNFSLLVLSLPIVRLSSISLLADARRSRPNMPIVVILNGNCRDSIPTGLADLVIAQPANEKALGRALRSLLAGPAGVSQAAAAAGAFV